MDSGVQRHPTCSSHPTSTTFPLPARRTQRADFPHWALVRGHALAHAKPRRPPRPAFPTALRPTARKARVFPDSAPATDAAAVTPAPVLPTAGGPALASLPHATPSGVSEPQSGLIGSCQPPRSLPPLRRPSRANDPFLRQHYPASSVLRASP